MAAHVGLAGMDPMRLLETQDQLEVLVMQAVASKRAELEQTISRSRAVDIANAINESRKEA